MKDRFALAWFRAISTFSLLVCATLLTSGLAQADPHPAETEVVHEDHGTLAEIGNKLANPVSDVWALFTQFGITSSDGDVNSGSPEAAGNIIFQPILPFPLFGEDKEEWKLIVRPTVPMLLAQPVPDGFNDFRHRTGLGDTALPMLVSPPTGSWLLGARPTFLFPTATQNDLGSDQWSMGPAAVVGYKFLKLTAVVFPQWYYKIGSSGQGSKAPVNRMSLLYSLTYSLPDAWQIISNPTVTYDRRARGRNQWNVPVGLGLAKTTKVGNMPVKFQFAFEYSVISQADFGQRFQAKLNVIPVMPSLVKKPLI